MESVKDIIEYYKDEKISKRSFEAEIGRLISPVFAFSVVLDDTTTLAQTNASYVAMMVPEFMNGIIRETLVIDNSLLINKISSDDAEKIIKICVDSTAICAKMLKDFYNMKNNTEVGLTECIAEYLDIYEYQTQKMMQAGLGYDLVKEQTIDMAKFNDAKISIENGTESVGSIVEFIKVNKLLPVYALEQAEKLFNNINLTGMNKVDTNKPIENCWWNHAVENTTSTVSPYGHEDLDPFYIPKR